MTGSQASAASFEVVKGERTVPVLSEAEVERHLDLGRLLDGLVTHAIWSLAIFVVVPLATPA